MRALGEMDTDDSDHQVFHITGLIISPPYGAITVQDGWSTIGSLIVTDEQVEAVPRHGLDVAQHGRLVAMAARVWMHGPQEAGCWWYHPALGWVAKVVARHSLRRDLSLSSAKPSMNSLSSSRICVPDGLMLPSGR